MRQILPPKPSQEPLLVQSPMAVTRVPSRFLTNIKLNRSWFNSRPSNSSPLKKWLRCSKLRPLLLSNNKFCLAGLQPANLPQINSNFFFSRFSNNNSFHNNSNSRSTFKKKAKMPQLKPQQPSRWLSTRHRLMCQKARKSKISSI